jgi:hypothetical protein
MMVYRYDRVESVTIQSWATPEVQECDTKSDMRCNVVIIDVYNIYYIVCAVGIGQQQTTTKRELL